MSDFAALVWRSFDHPLLVDDDEHGVDYDEDVDHFDGDEDGDIIDNIR